MPRAREQKNLTLQDEALAWLEGIDNASRYVGDLVSRRRSDTLQALARLQVAGWSRAAILAAAEALDGAPSAYLAVEMEGAERVDGVAAKWGVTDWPERVEQVREDREVAEDLRLVVEEFWRHREGSELARRLEVAREGGEET